MSLVERLVMLPAYDEHFQQFSWYQHSVYKLAIKHVDKFRGAIDIGAHVGYFSMYMAHDFEKVVAFEPIAINAKCWEHNLVADTNATLFQAAVGNSIQPLRMTMPDHVNSGSWAVADYGHEVVEQVILDNFHFVNIDYIKIDVQGYELAVLKGAVRTINHSKPIIQLEMSTEESIRKAGGFMSKLGYAPVEQYKDDVIWKFTGEYNKKRLVKLHVSQEAYDNYITQKEVHSA